MQAATELFRRQGRAVDESVQESYVNAFYASLPTIRTGLSDGDEGLAELVDGLGQAKAGAARLHTGSRRSPQSAVEVLALTVATVPKRQHFTRQDLHPALTAP